MANNNYIANQQWLYKPPFPEDWEEYNLFSLASWLNGMAFRDFQFSATGAPIIKIAEIKNGITEQTKFTQSRYDSEYFIKQGDMLFAWSGQPETSIDVHWWFGPEGWLNQHIHKVTPSNHCNLVFFFYILKYLKPNFVAIARNKQTTGLGHVTIKDLQRMVVRIPKQDVQRTIADVLGSLDDKIELNRRTNATLESMARAVFHQWFVEGEEAKGWEDRSLEELFGKRSECVLTGPFGSHLHAHDYREEGTPLILVKHVIDGHILEKDLPLVGEHKLPEMKRYKLEIGDIVFTRVGAVGRSAYVHPHHKGWLISGQTLRARVPDRNKLNPRFLAQIYLEPSFIEMVEQNALGTTRPSLNTNILLSFKFPLPPIELQNRFAEFAGAIDNKVQHNIEESRTMASLRDALLPRLMSGEVRVKDSI